MIKLILNLGLNEYCCENFWNFLFFDYVCLNVYVLYYIFFWVQVNGVLKEKEIVFLKLNF